MERGRGSDRESEEEDQGGVHPDGRLLHPIHPPLFCFVFLSVLKKPHSSFISPPSLSVFSVILTSFSLFPSVLLLHALSPSSYQPLCYSDKIFPSCYLGNRPIQSLTLHCVQKTWRERARERSWQCPN